MKIDYDNLGKGFNEMLNEEDKAIMAFGMIPNHVFQKFLDMIYIKIAEVKLQSEGIEQTPALVDMTKGCITKEFKRQVEQNLSKAIYKHAKMVV